MNRGPALAQQSVAPGRSDETIEQTIAMNVTAFLAAEKKSNSAKTMHADPHLGNFARGHFDRADRPQAPRMKERRDAQKHGVENLRSTWNGREPFQPTHSELEDHPWSSFSTGARSATEGPFRTLPCASKREPWQGQSHVVSVRFQCTMHFKCGQMAVIS